jgi:glycosyltransferase involved in cell wall biosynthesis
MESLDGKKKNKFTFIFIGRLIKQKGVDILLRAFAQLKESELLIVGSGLEEDDYKSLAKELKIENNVKFLGIRKDIPDLLAYADCFVLPSRYEGLPMVLLEAVASKKVIILSDFESAREIIKDNENGFVVQREDWQGLAKVMDLVKNDPEVFGKIKSGVASDSLKFSIKTHVDFLVGLF